MCGFFPGFSRACRACGSWIYALLDVKYGKDVQLMTEGQGFAFAFHVAWLLQLQIVLVVTILNVAMGPMWRTTDLKSLVKGCLLCGRGLSLEDDVRQCCVASTEQSMLQVLPRRALGV